MNTIKIYLKTSGSVAELHKDFAMYVGSYQNKLIDVYVPKDMLYSNKQNTFANTVKIAGLLTATNGQQITTEARYLDHLKEISIDGIDYVVYERRLPKELTVYPGNQQLVINVVSVDNTTIDTPKVLQVITTQTCNLLVQNSEYLDDQETLEPSQLEEINSKLAENQGDIVNLQERMETAETNIAKNTEDISQNTSDIANLKQVVGSGEDYIGTLNWTKAKLPTDSELDDVVREKRNRTSKTSDVIIVVKQITGATDKNYKFIKALSDWTYYEIPPMEYSGNGTTGIVAGTYAVGKDYDMLVDIAGGEILNIYVKDSSNQYRNIVEYLNSNKLSIDKIINGTTKVGIALKSISDGVGNNIVDTYLTKTLGVTKSEMRDYALPREFNDVYYINSQGYSKQIPTSPESGIQFSAVSDNVGDTSIFQITKENSADFELSSKNGYSNNIYISSNKDCEVSFRLSTEYKKKDEENWNYLNVELTAPITLTTGNIEKLIFANPFAYLEEKVIILTDGDLLRQTLEVIAETSEEITFDIYSNQTYPSIFNLTSQSYTLSEVESVIGRELVLGGDGIIENKQAIFEIKNAESLVEYKTPYRRFLLNLHLPVSGELDPTYPVLINFGGTIYNLYNLITGNEEISTIGDLVSVENYSDEGGYFFNLEVIYIQSDDFAGFFVIPSALTAKQIEAIIKDSDTIITDLDESKTKLNIHLSADIVNKLAKVLVRPTSAPASTELVAISPQNVQQLLELGVGLEVKNGHLEIVLNDEIAPFVDYSKTQNLTNEQKAQARANIGAGSEVIAVESVNGKTGVINLSADDVGALDNEDIVDNLTSSDTEKVLSANQGRVLNEAQQVSNQQMTLLKSNLTQLNNSIASTQESVDEVSEKVDVINSKIPNSATSTNQLVDKASMNTNLSTKKTLIPVSTGSNTVSLSSYWFPIWKQTKAVGANNEISYLVDVGTGHGHNYEFGHRGIFLFSIRQNLQADLSDANVFIDIFAGDLRGSQFKLHKNTDNLLELWVNTVEQYRKFSGEVLSVRGRGPNENYITDPYGTWVNQNYTAVQTPTGTEQTNIFKTNEYSTPILNIHDSVTGYSETPSSARLLKLLFDDKNKARLALIDATIGATWNALNFSLVGKDGTGNTLEFVYYNANTPARFEPTTTHQVDLGNSTNRRFGNIYAKKEINTTGTFVTKNTNITRGTAPSANSFKQNIFADSNDAKLGCCEHGYLTDKTSYTSIIAYNGTNASDTTPARISAGFDANGNIYTYAPTPSVISNDTNIATTKWVKDILKTTPTELYNGTVSSGNTVNLKDSLRNYSLITMFFYVQASITNNQIITFPSSALDKMNPLYYEQFISGNTYARCQITETTFYLQNYSGLAEGSSLGLQIYGW